MKRAVSTQMESWAKGWIEHGENKREINTSGLSHKSPFAGATHISATLNRVTVDALLGLHQAQTVSEQPLAQSESVVRDAKPRGLQWE